MSPSTPPASGTASPIRSPALAAIGSPRRLHSDSPASRTELPKVKPQPPDYKIGPRCTRTSAVVRRSWSQPCPRPPTSMLVRRCPRAWLYQWLYAADATPGARPGINLLFRSLIWIIHRGPQTSAGSGRWGSGVRGRPLRSASGRGLACQLGCHPGLGASTAAGNSGPKPQPVAAAGREPRVSQEIMRSPDARLHSFAVQVARHPDPADVRARPSMSAGLAATLAVKGVGPLRLVRQDSRVSCSMYIRKLPRAGWKAMDTTRMSASIEPPRAVLPSRQPPLEYRGSCVLPRGLNRHGPLLASKDVA